MARSISQTKEQADQSANVVRVIRVEADSGDGLLQLVRSHRRADPTLEIVAVLPGGLDDDEMVSLCAVLAVEGVADIEGAPRQMVQRCFDTVRAISAGGIEGVRP